MRIVSEQSEEDIKRRQAEADVTNALRKFAANFLRVVRGAGRTHEIWNGMAECIHAAQRYFDSHGTWPHGQLIHDALDHRRALEEFKPWIKENLGGRYPSELDMALDRVCRAALQKIASTLVDQTPQRGSAVNELHAAIRDVEETLRERNRPTGKGNIKL